MASDTLFQNYSTEFETNWREKAQQKKHRLEGTYMADTFTGERKMYNRIMDQEAQDQTTRKGDTPIANPDTDQRWIYHGAKELGNDLDQFDEALLGTVVLPTSTLVKSHAMAFNRAKDRTLLTAAVGNAFSGKLGTTTNALPAGQTIAANYDNSGTDIGLTFSKLLRIREIFADAGVDIDGADGEEEGIVLTVTEKQITDLLKDVKLTSRDYVGEVMSLKTGKINHFLGIEFKRLNSTAVNPLLPVTATIRDCVAYAKSALAFATGETKTSIDRIPTKQNKIQIYSVQKMGAVRLWDDRVIKVRCKEI